MKACEKCKSEEWQERIERLLDRCEEELETGRLAKRVLEELLSGL